MEIIEKEKKEKEFGKKVEKEKIDERNEERIVCWNWKRKKSSCWGLIEWLKKNIEVDWGIVEIRVKKICKMSKENILKKSFRMGDMEERIVLGKFDKGKMIEGMGEEIMKEIRKLK